jgi:hypothetical protein
MKKFKKNILFSAIVIVVGLTSCFDEKDDDYKIIGAVGTVSVMTVSKAEPAAGEQISVNVRYYSEHVAVSQLRLTQTIGSGTPTVVSTKDITSFDTNNSYQDVFSYVVPAAPLNTVIRLTLEIETANALTNNSKFVNITVK